MYICMYINIQIYVHSPLLPAFFADTRFFFINTYPLTPQLARVAYRRQAFAD